MAVGEPATRAPTMIASYIVDDLECGFTRGVRRVIVDGSVPTPLSFDRLRMSGYV
jgi:hypothetical protein